MSTNIANRLKRIEEVAFGGKAEEYKNTCFRFNLRRVRSLVMNEALIALIEDRELSPILADRLYAPIPKGTPQHHIDEACRDEAGGRYDRLTPEQWQNLYREAVEDRRRLVNLHKNRIDMYRQHGWKTLPGDAEENRLMIEWIEAEFGPVEPDEEPALSPENEHDYKENEVAFDKIIEEYQESNPPEQPPDIVEKWDRDGVFDS